MRVAKKRCALLLALLLTGSCVACTKDIQITTGFGKYELFRIAEESEDIRILQLLLLNEKNEYEKSLGSDIWEKELGDVNLEEEVKEKIKKQMVELNVIYHMAKENEVTLSGEENDKLKEAAKQYYGLLETEVKERLDLNEEQIFRFYEKMYLSDKYYDIKIAENEKEISDEDARVIEVLYVFFRLGERDVQGNVVKYPAEQEANIRSEAQTVLALADAGNDFGALAQEYSDDSQYRLTFGRGTMEEVFEEAAFALKEGEHSGMIETEEGIYLIKSVSDYLPEATEENKESLRERYQAEQFKKIYEPYLEKLTLQFQSKMWEAVTLNDFDGCDCDSVIAYYEQYFTGKEE